ncbi:MAG TPA: response regulator [Aquabacterium sp.]|uniref:response regulator n=1 Tax=Aquabacterium sp. TaxID=1872578 RepID=UPI002E362C5E|nr:response regulator [Aquabacterium sp.]HEX5354846.1 response regulator [Aquabacterium sp.]
MLILDDESNVIAALRRLIRQHYQNSLEVMAFVDPLEALDRVRDTAFNVVMSDFRMPAMTGLAFLEQVRLVQPHAIRMILSASYDFDIIQKAVNDVEVFRYMAKPWDERELLTQIQAGLDKSTLGQQERALADAMRLQQGAMSPADLELKRLEEQEPGITVVDWGPNGEVIMPDGLLDSDIEPKTRRS